MARPKGGLDTKLKADTEAKGRSLKNFMTAGRVIGHSEAASCRAVCLLPFE